jgi:excisionase family DNA binding protein
MAPQRRSPRSSWRHALENGAASANDDNVQARIAGEPRLAFSPDEVAAALGISRELVNDLLRTGKLQSVKAGRRRLISCQHLESFLAGDAA